MRRWLARELVKNDKTMLGFWPLQGNLLDYSGNALHINPKRTISLSNSSEWQDNAQPHYRQINSRQGVNLRHGLYSSSSYDSNGAQSNVLWAGRNNRNSSASQLNFSMTDNFSVGGWVLEDGQNPNTGILSVTNPTGSSVSQCYSLLLNGSGSAEKALSSDVMMPHGSENISVCFWVKFKNAITTPHTFITWGINVGPSQVQPHFNVYNSGGIRISAQVNSSAVVTSAAVSPLSLNVWYHVHLVHNAIDGISYLYLNGVAVDIQTPVDNKDWTTVGTNGLIIGEQFGYTLNCEIADFRCYGSIIINSNVDTIYNSGLGSCEDGLSNPSIFDLRVWIPFNEGVDTTATDYSGYGNDSTLTAAADWASDSPLSCCTSSGGTEIANHGYSFNLTTLGTNFSKTWLGLSFSQGDSVFSSMQYYVSLRDWTKVFGGASTKWWHVFLVYNGQKYMINQDPKYIQIYVNGRLMPMDIHRNTFIPNGVTYTVPTTADITLGWVPPFPNMEEAVINGDVAVVRAYNRLLSTRQIEETYYAEKDMYRPRTRSRLGIETINNNCTLYIGTGDIGATGIDNDCTLYVAGPLTNTSGIPLFLNNHDEINKNTNLFIRGNDDFHTLNLFINCQTIPDSGNPTLYINACTSGTNGMQSYSPLHIDGIAPSASLNLFINNDGKATDINNMNLFTQGRWNSIDYSYVPLTVCNTSSGTNNSVSLITEGLAWWSGGGTTPPVTGTRYSGGLNLHIHTKPGIDKVLPLFVRCTNPNHDTTLFIKGATIVNNNVSLSIPNTIGQSGTSPPLFISGY